MTLEQLKKAVERAKRIMATWPAWKKKDWLCPLPNNPTPRPILDDAVEDCRQDECLPEFMRP